MPESKRQKNIFDLSGGLNTELNEIQWPDGYTVDEANYELLTDGSRRRRRGLASEAGNTAQTIATLGANEVCQIYKWRNVGGDPTVRRLVYQIGGYLYITDDDEEPSNSWDPQGIDLQQFTAESSPTATNYSDYPVRFAQGRGHLFVTGPYIKPFYVTYTASTTDYEANLIPISYRDFEGIDDGVDVAYRPADGGGGAPDPDHRYNLRNRGWSDADINAIEASGDQLYPAKNGLWYKAYSRAETTGNTYDPEGNQTLDVGRYDAEQFGLNSAPQGSLFLNPFDTTYAGTVTGAGAQQIEDWTVADDTADPWVVTLTVTGHGLSHPTNVTIEGNKFNYEFTLGGGWLETGSTTASLDGTYATTATAANTISFQYPRPNNFYVFNSKDPDGNIGSAGYEALAKSDGTLVQRGFKAIAFHAGRVWYAGMADGKYADHVFFSRIASETKAYGQCHQVADPTHPEFNAITPADGGVIVIPGMSGVTDSIVVGNSLIFVGSEGAWEVAGNRGAVFTATAYNVRKVTNANLDAPMATKSYESVGLAAGPSGIYQFAPNQYTGIIEASNMIENTIQTKWNGYTAEQQKFAQCAYDDAKRRIYFMIPGDDTASPAVDRNDHREMLIFDIKHKAWYRYTFSPATNYKLLALVAITEADNPTSNEKMKFLYAASTTTVDIADFDQTDYLDFDGAESPLPYLVTGYDPLQDFQRRGQAPVITVFQKRTETGYDAELDDAVNASSTTMTAFWDWTDSKEYDSVTSPTAQQDWTGTAGNYGVSGKIGAKSQVYRTRAPFIPLAQTDVDGFPVVVTRNKVRGRGRVLSLRFDGAATYDSHLLGWTINTKTSPKY